MSAIIENGALFEGSCRMVQLKEQLDKQPGAATASAATSANASSSGIPTPSYKPSSAPNAAAAKTAPSGSSADVKEATDVAS